MLETALTALVAVMSIAGAGALVVRLLRSGARLALCAAEANAATGLADVSARRGDVTGMMERRAAAQVARRERRGALALAFLWLVWLVVPVFAGWAREAFALAAVLWLVPNQPIRPRPDPTSD
jgi:hypothetical protein